MIRTHRAAWHGEEAPRIESLPDKIPLHQLLKVQKPYETAGMAKYRVPVGVATDDLTPLLSIWRMGRILLWRVRWKAVKRHSFLAGCYHLHIIHRRMSWKSIR